MKVGIQYIEGKIKDGQKYFGGIMSKTVIIGGVAGGATAAARLRRLDGDMEIIVLERGDYISYANCGLPYHIGGVIKKRSSLLLQTPQAMKDKFNIDVRIGNEVIAIDRDKKEVAVRRADGGEYRENYDNLIFATGSKPFVPPMKGVETPGVFTLWTVPDTDRIKEMIDCGGAKSAAVIGGGFIGLEVAENLRELGMDVVVIEAQNQVMANFDYEMAQILHTELSRNGIDLRLSDGVKEIRACAASAESSSTESSPTENAACSCACRTADAGKSDDRKHADKCGEETSRDEKCVDKKCADEKRGGDERSGIEIVLEKSGSVKVDMVVMSIGIRPNNELAKAAGLRLGERGGVVTDAYMRTSDPHIWAAGDVVEIEHFVTKKPAMIPLAGPANKQGRIIANNIVAQERGEELEAYNGSMGTGIAKIFGLTAGAVGLNERILVAQGKKVGEDFHIVQIRQRSHASYYPGAKEMDIRVIFDKEGKILGAQLIGEDGVDKRIDIIATVMSLGGTVESLKKLELSYAPPYSSAKDPVNMVGFVAGNILSGMVKIRMPLEVKKLHEEGALVVLDVTENAEREQWAMENSLHIPHGQVRARLSELPKEKEICIYCAVGVRAYNVARILSQNGHEKVSICAGGRGFYRLASYGK